MYIDENLVLHFDDEEFNAKDMEIFGKKPTMIKGIKRSISKLFFKEEAPNFTADDEDIII